MTGLLVVAGDNAAAAQLWLINYPEGTVTAHNERSERVSRDRITQDGKKFTTVQAQGLVNLWIVPDGDATKATDCRRET